jgi:hypothetical protein
MGVLARILRIAWARWGDYNSFVAILDLFDWKTRFFGFIGGMFMMLLGVDVWTTPGLVLAGLAAAAFVSVIVIAFRILAIRRPIIMIGGDQAGMHGEVTDREGSDNAT